MAVKDQPQLRLVVSKDEPRRYAQSTSGRMSSTGTAPPLSRSSAIAVDSAIRSFVDSAFRKYPTEVPQRAAYESWESRSSELRYDRSDSIGRTLPYSNVLAIPFVHLPQQQPTYHREMDREKLKKLRKARLALLVEELGSQVALANLLGSEENYISQLLSPSKSFGEQTARKIEAAARKPSGWLDTTEVVSPSARQEWPFSFDRAFWDRLHPSQQAEIEAAFQKMVLGASVQELAIKRPKRKPA
jgi:hypothetical protein